MAIASLIISFLVACAVIYREFVYRWLFKPNLQVEFSLNEPISRETLLVNNKRGFWPRLRVTNNGRSAARRCEGILAKVRMPDGTLNKRYDPLTLRWAIAPVDKGLEPLDIACGRQVDLNIFTTIENESMAQFATYADPRGIPLFLEPGDYWLHIIICGDNFEPVERGYAVHWDGKDYRKVAMQEMNENLRDASDWPYQLLSNSEEPSSTVNSLKGVTERQDTRSVIGLEERFKKVERKIEYHSYLTGAIAFLALGVTLMVTAGAIVGLNARPLLVVFECGIAYCLLGIGLLVYSHRYK